MGALKAYLWPISYVYIYPWPLISQLCVYPLVAQLYLPHSLLSYMKALIVQLGCTTLIVQLCVDPLIVQLCVCPLIVQLRVHPPLLSYMKPLIAHLCVTPHYSYTHTLHCSSLCIHSLLSYMYPLIVHLCVSPHYSAVCVVVYPLIAKLYVYP